MSDAFPPEIVERIETAGVIAVLVVDEAADAVPLARALLAGGVDVMASLMGSQGIPECCVESETMPAASRDLQDR